MKLKKLEAKALIWAWRAEQRVPARPKFLQLQEFSSASHTHWDPTRISTEQHVLIESIVCNTNPWNRIPAVRAVIINNTSINEHTTCLTRTLKSLSGFDVMCSSKQKRHQMQTFSHSCLSLFLCFKIYNLYWKYTNKMWNRIIIYSFALHCNKY